MAAYLILIQCQWSRSPRPHPFRPSPFRQWCVKVISFLSGFFRRSYICLSLRPWAMGFLFSLMALIIWDAAKSSYAADHTNLEENLPTEVEDAYPLPYLNRELQGVFRYEQMEDGSDQFRLDPRIEVGFARNWQARISVPFLLGNAEQVGSRNLALEAMYNFNTESLRLPAFSLSGGLVLPTGENSNGVDTRLRFLASKAIGRTSLLQRVHLNLGWLRNSAPMPNERDNRYLLIVGYSARIARATFFVGDFVREQQRRKNTNRISWN